MLQQTFKSKNIIKTNKEKKKDKRIQIKREIRYNLSTHSLMIMQTK